MSIKSETTCTWAGVPNAEELPDWWYEYTVKLLNDEGNVVDEWDSLVECYNGAQRLTMEEAEKAIEEIRRDVEERGCPERWFRLRR